MRDTCLYCEQEGKVTKLVRTAGHWRLCPIHSASYIQSIRHPTVRELLAMQGCAPVLQDKGRPTVNGVKV